MRGASAPPHHRCRVTTRKGLPSPTRRATVLVGRRRKWCCREQGGLHVLRNVRRVVGAAAGLALVVVVPTAARAANPEPEEARLLVEARVVDLTTGDVVYLLDDEMVAADDGTAVVSVDTPAASTSDLFQPFDATSGSQTQGQVTARLTINYDLRSSGQDIRVSSVSGAGRSRTRRYGCRTGRSATRTPARQGAVTTRRSRRRRTASATRPDGVGCRSTRPPTTLARWRRQQRGTGSTGWPATRSSSW